MSPTYFASTLLALLAISLTTNALSVPNKARITGGELAEQGQFPAVASFVRGVCTGVLISEHWLLTTAVCLAHIEPFGLYVFAGNVNKSSNNGQVGYTSRFVVHQDFTFETLTHNLGLIRLFDDLEFNSNVGAAIIEQIEVNSSCTIVGWGATELGEYDSLQRYADNMVVLDNAECEERLGRKVDEESEFCAYGGEGRGPCGGDEGSPLFHNEKLVGILSNGIDYCEENKPQIYVNVAKLGRWIWENTGIVV